MRSRPASYKINIYARILRSLGFMREQGAACFLGSSRSVRVGLAIARLRFESGKRMFLGELPE